VRVQPQFGETLPVLLRRRVGVPERVTLAVAAAVVLVGVVGYLLIHDPLQGKTQVVHRSAPVFNTLYRSGTVKPVAPQPGELQRYRGAHGQLRTSLAIRPLRLPAYTGDVGGALPVAMERHVAALRQELPGLEVTGEGRTRVGGAPAYQVNFRYGPRRRNASGSDVLVIPVEPRAARDGVVISMRQVRGAKQPGPAEWRVITATKAIIRAFRFGTARE
jgi:hypothetical protein